MRKLKKYSCSFSVDASIVVEVEAHTKKEAKEKAWEKAYAPRICHQCSRGLSVGDVIALVEVDDGTN